MWDNELQPYIFEISNFEKKGLFITIATGEKPSLINEFKSLAYFHAHKTDQGRYVYQEAYFITCSDTVSKSELYEIFLSDPEGSIEIIRRDGRLIFSHLENMYENRT